MKRLTILHALLALFFVALPARAAIISWGSDFSSFPAPELLTSSSVPLDANYSFEIGSFGSFIPTAGNVMQWKANWKVFDRSYDPTPLDLGDGDPFGWNPGMFFTGVETHNALGGSDSADATPGAVFGTGEVAYLWAYNFKDIVPGTEWALVMDSNHTAGRWQFGDPSDLDSSWSLATADTAIVGSVNSSPTLALQTAVVVPEPGSAFLLFAALATQFFRRTRRFTGEGNS